MFNKVAQQALQRLFAFCKKPASMDILHSAVFGLGIISQRIDSQTFKSIRSDILAIVSNIITAADAFSEKKASLAENSINVLGKIALYQSEKDEKLSEEILLKFLQFLPLKHDIDEAQAAHKMLLQEIVAKNQVLTCGSQEVQNALIQAISNINKMDSNNPESEILDDESKKLINQVINSQ